MDHFLNHWQEFLSLVLTAAAVLYVTHRKVREIRSSRTSCDGCVVARRTVPSAVQPRKRSQ